MTQFESDKFLKYEMFSRRNAVKFIAQSAEFSFNFLDFYLDLFIN